MTKKSSSPEAAQKRVWKAEMKTLGRNYRKILSDALKAQKIAAQEVRAAQRKYAAVMKRIDTQVPRATAAIERRVAILEGRIGV